MHTAKMGSIRSHRRTLSSVNGCCCLGPPRWGGEQARVGPSPQRTLYPVAILFSNSIAELVHYHMCFSQELLASEGRGVISEVQCRDGTRVAAAASEALELWQA